MPVNKDLKRLVRARMKKTGEAYTTARAQLLKKRSPRHPPASAARTVARAATPVPTPPASAVPDPAEYERLAGMSNAAIKAKTGCDWARWVWALDRNGAAELPHREIARHIHDKYKLTGWWAQTVTVGYERIRGLREIGQRRGGAYEASKSKTFNVPVARLYRAFADPRVRSRWFGGQEHTVRTAAPNKTMRLGWSDDTIVSVYFTPKGAARSQVAIQHLKLPDRATAMRMKEFWSERLRALERELAE
jgi:hypothetical protein